MADQFYPTIREEQIMVLNVVVQNLAKDPSYLTNPACPYNDVVKAFFRKNQDAVAVEDIFSGKDETLVLDEQIQKLLSDLEAFALTLTDADHSEKLSYFKTKTVLIERLISMKERVYNLKELNEFRLAVIRLLDEVCTKDQVTTFLKSLDGVFGNDIR